MTYIRRIFRIHLYLVTIERIYFDQTRYMYEKKRTDFQVNLTFTETKNNNLEIFCLSILAFSQANRV